MEMEISVSSSDRICFKVLVLFLVAARVGMYTLLKGESPEMRDD
jgi:hypothetical protein